MSKKGRPSSRSKSTDTNKKASKPFNFSGLIKVLVVVASLFGVASLAVSANLKQSKIEHDLSVIGNGKPTVVQVHDPSCPLCMRLKGNLEKVKGDFKDDIQFKTADINKKSGKIFARQHQVSYVTLVFFDKKGKRLDTMQGVSTPEDIRDNLNGIR